MTAQLHTIGWDIPLEKADESMHEHNVRHLPVLKDGKLVGILSQRNLEAARSWPGSDRFACEDVMLDDVFTARQNTPVVEVALKMAEQKLGSTIVVDDQNKAVGVFTTVDACRALSRALEG